MEQIKEALQELLDEKEKDLFEGIRSDIDIQYYFEPEMTSFDELRDAVESGNGFEVEIIYYGRAMEYLTENDTSLNESMDLAAEMGFTPENINSELLATLLASQNARTEFEELEGEFDDYFEEVDEIKTDIELLDDEDEIESIKEKYNL